MTDYNSLEEAFNRLALITERDTLAQQLAESQAKYEAVSLQIRDCHVEADRLYKIIQIAQDRADKEASARIEYQFKAT